MVAVNFGRNLKELRKKHGYSREQLAQEISYSAKAIEKWELGGMLPPVTIICRLANRFHVSVDALLYANSTEIQYLLGIDGGGTKTEFLLTDLNKKEIRRLVLEASNPIDIGMENCQKILTEGITKVCEGINLREVSVFAGLAGGISSNNKELLRQFFSRFSFGRVKNGSDIESTIEMAFGEEDGIVVIMGTGIIVYPRSKGEMQRVGGWGYLIDKGGSGYHFGLDAIACALRCVDGRGGSEFIKSLVEQQLGQPVEQAIAEIYQKRKAFIASFANVVFTAYEAGDSYAEQIIRRNVKEVAELIQTGLQKTQSRSVAICGGLCRYSDILSIYLQEELGDCCQIAFVNKPIVDGAISLAYKNIEKEI